MFENFRKYLSAKVDLTEAEIQMVQAACVIKKLRKRQYLLQEGDISRHKAFIASGCMRMYRVDENGAEFILRFAVENWWMSDRESYVSGKPSSSFIDALEDTVLVTWTKDSWDELCRNISALKAMEEKILARSFDASQNRIYATISLSSEEKFKHFITTYPNLLNRIPQQMIASFLGISRETLSRIKSSHFSNKSDL